jgi:substrate import-associated zinc metallohydrolase lipoprotein
MLTISIVLGCSKSDDVSAPVEGLGGEVLPKNNLDAWLNTNFTQPYNIEVKYRWDPYEVPLEKTLVPPFISQVQPIMQAVKSIWIEPYVKEAGADFVKKFCPKQYVLVGSPNYNSDGTITLGTAEGGRKVVLFEVNNFSQQNLDGVKFTLHVIHHEFGHILHQNIAYPVAFKQITPGTYTSNWYNVSDAQAYALGYITPYSMSGTDEDFVEMIATMLVEGKSGFDAIVEAIPSATGRAAIRQKEQIVITYFKQAYNIDFRSLQTTTQAAIANYVK